MSIVYKSFRRIKRNAKNFKKRWKAPFKKIKIPSSLDGHIQQAYYYRPDTDTKTPLIVTLHSWAATYKQPEAVISKYCVEKGWNYIRPNFRGKNNKPSSVGSELSMSDINDAIKYAIDNGNVDTDNIFIVGGSGGAFATLCFYSATKHPINTYIAWSPITDLIAWHDQSIARGNRYAKDILNATKSDGELDIVEAKKRSPLFREFPQRNSEFHLFSGYNDGADHGPVPVTHTINFYNKFAAKQGASDLDLFSKEEIIKLTSREIKPTKEKIDGRNVITTKKFKNISATIFVGGHENLPKHSIKIINKNVKL